MSRCDFTMYFKRRIDTLLYNVLYCPLCAESSRSYYCCEGIIAGRTSRVGLRRTHFESTWISPCVFDAPIIGADSNRQCGCRTRRAAFAFGIVLHNCMRTNRFEYKCNALISSSIFRIYSATASAALFHHLLSTMPSSKDLREIQYCRAYFIDKYASQNPDSWKSEKRASTITLLARELRLHRERIVKPAVKGYCDSKRFNLTTNPKVKHPRNTNGQFARKSYYSVFDVDDASRTYLLEKVKTLLHGVKEAPFVPNRNGRWAKWAAVPSKWKNIPQYKCIATLCEQKLRILLGYCDEQPLVLRSSFFIQYCGRGHSAPWHRDECIHGSVVVVLEDNGIIEFKVSRLAKDPDMVHNHERIADLQEGKAIAMCPGLTHAVTPVPRKKEEMVDRCSLVMFF